MEPGGFAIKLDKHYKQLSYDPNRNFKNFNWKMLSLWKPTMLVGLHGMAALSVMSAMVSFPRVPDNTHTSQLGVTPAGASLGRGATEAFLLAILCWEALPGKSLLG